MFFTGLNKSINTFIFLKWNSMNSWRKFKWPRSIQVTEITSLDLIRLFSNDFKYFLWFLVEAPCWSNQLYFTECYSGQDNLVPIYSWPMTLWGLSTVEFHYSIWFPCDCHALNGCDGDKNRNSLRSIEVQIFMFKEAIKRDPVIKYSQTLFLVSFF